MAQTNRLKPVGEDEPLELITDPPPPRAAPPPPQGRDIQVLTTMLLTALKALSQRTIVALSNLFVLATAGSAFALWWVTMPNPSVLQLIGLSLYAAFLLLLHGLRQVK